MIYLEEIIQTDSILNCIFLMIENLVYDKEDLDVNTELINKINFELNRRIAQNENIDMRFLIISFSLLENLKQILYKDQILSFNFKKILKKFLYSTQKNQVSRSGRINKSINKHSQTGKTYEAIKRKSSSSQDHMYTSESTSDSSLTCSESNNNMSQRTIFSNKTSLLFTQWMEKNVSSPYISKVELQILKKITGLTEKKITNWLVNNRRRRIPNFFKSATKD
ncbi:Homeobox protein HD-12 [Cucumispora dikerogammari]|nr:Homeobox protein HD-12 [Cucumispora dikerogammari]